MRGSPFEFLPNFPSISVFLKSYNNFIKNITGPQLSLSIAEAVNLPLPTTMDGEIAMVVQQTTVAERIRKRSLLLVYSSKSSNIKKKYDKYNMLREPLQDVMLSFIALSWQISQINY